MPVPRKLRSQRGVVTIPAPLAKSKVRLRLPSKPIYVGSYLRVPVIVAPRAGVRFDDLDFVLPDGRKAGVISPSRDSQFDPKKPHIMFIGGYEPGRHRIRAMNRRTGKMVLEQEFVLTSEWKDESAGPSQCVAGVIQGFVWGSAWGGGPSGPQNVGVNRNVGTRRIAILLVDTASQRFTTDANALQGHRDRWMDEIIDGVTDGGVTRSARAFYREVSYGQLDLAADVYGPVQLPGSWDDYYDANGIAKGALPQAAATAADALINYRNYDILLIVSQSVDATSTSSAKSAWPYSWGATVATADGDIGLSLISMPNEWGVSNNREIHEVASHELGHTLGLRDQYTPHVPGRNVGPWDMMHDDDRFPHFTAVTRLMEGWIDPSWVESFNFAQSPGPVDQDVTLHPIELGTPPSGRKSVIEVRIADGFNYYFEYRSAQTAQIGDQNLPADDRVLGTDVISNPSTAPTSRPTILLLADDRDGDGAVLGTGQDFSALDYSEPTFPAEFHVTVKAIGGGKAVVNVKYGVNGKPDPSIRPWPASPDRQWQSPDIEIRNARNQADPAWYNVPWLGNANTIVARITNRGNVSAPGVRANFYIKDYNVGGTPETFLASVVHDIGPGATVDFSAVDAWVPPHEGHFCVIVRIPLYQTPDALRVPEMTELNNEAQSNYGRFISATSVPLRLVTSVKVGNPFPVRTRVFILPRHTNPVYRTYLQNRWLWLDPGETRKVEVMYEFAPDSADDPRFTGAQREKLKVALREPNNVSLVSFIDDPRGIRPHLVGPFGGAQAQIITGKSTRFARFVAGDGRAAGSIVKAEDGVGVKGGQVIVRLRNQGEKRLKYFAGTVSAQGTFIVKIDREFDLADAYYVPAKGYADCWSEGAKG